LNGEEVERVKICSLDPFGRTWKISAILSGQDEREIVLYSWHQDFGSIVPPKRGWIAEEGLEPCPIIAYQFSHDSY